MEMRGVKRDRNCDCDKCTGVVDLRASPIELTEAMARKEPGLITSMRRKMMLAAADACQVKALELYDGGIQLNSGDQLEHDMATVVVVAAHVKKSLGMKFSAA